MPWPAISEFQIAKDLSNNASLITTPAWYVGDFRQLTVSLSTQSAGALNIQVSNDEGLQSPINENSWRNVLTPSVNSVFALTTGVRWSRSSSQAASNHTIVFAGRT